jgi:hypothetical protein
MQTAINATKLKCLYLLQEERFFFLSIYKLHWVLPYHALNSDFDNFETPRIIGIRDFFIKISIKCTFSLKFLGNILIFFN